METHTAGPTRVLNISSTILSSPEIQLLCKGLSFCPTPQQMDCHDFNESLYDFSRKMRLKYHFRNNQDKDSSIVKLPSAFVPPLNQDAELEKMIHQLKRLTVRKVGKEGTRKHQNMSVQLQEAKESIIEKVASI